MKVRLGGRKRIRIGRGGEHVRQSDLNLLPQVIVWPAEGRPLHEIGAFFQGVFAAKSGRPDDLHVAFSCPVRSGDEIKWWLGMERLEAGDGEKKHREREAQKNHPRRSET